VFLSSRMQSYVLFESAAGYALFERREVEEIGSKVPKVEEALLNFSSFVKTCSLKAFIPFSSPQSSLENINDISEGILNEFLKEFLEMNMPKVRKNVILGVSESQLGSAIESKLHIKCEKNAIVLELLRFIRYHFDSFLKNATSGISTEDGFLLKMQRGLSHSYGRAKVKFNVNKSDNMIIQSISLLDQMDKDINTFAMRVREWYSWHFPELVRMVNDNIVYARIARYLKNRADITEEIIGGLAEIVGSSEKAKLIFQAAKTSMGYEVSDFDMKSVTRFADRVVHLAEYRADLLEYLHRKMHDIAPNLTALIGEMVGARLINHAGSLTTLAKYPSSTVQILGAEKALFRALKTRGNTPKYGLIFNSAFIGRAKVKDKGRISRYLANKAVIASRIDAFSDAPTSKFGEILKQQVEDRLKFFESGDIPAKNVDVMQGVIKDLKGGKGKSKKEEKPKKNVEKSTESSSSESDSDSSSEELGNGGKAEINGEESEESEGEAEEMEEAKDELEEMEDVGEDVEEEVIFQKGKKEKQKIQKEIKGNVKVQKKR